MNTREARIVLIEAAGAVLGPFDPKLQRYTQTRLEKMGVEVRLNTAAVAMDDDSITVKGPDGQEERIPAKTKIWAAGVQANPLAKMLAEETGAETDRAGRVAVQPDCTLPAVGDMVSLNKLPGVAQPAMQEGKYVGKLIKARLAGQADTTPFKYFNKGSMATIGHLHAVADAFGVKVTGLIGYTIWGFIHVMYLIGWGNRIGAMLTWARALTFTKNRGNRIITLEMAQREMARHDEAPAVDPDPVPRAEPAAI